MRDAWKWTLASFAVGIAATLLAGCPFMGNCNDYCDGFDPAITEGTFALSPWYDPMEGDPVFERVEVAGDRVVVHVLDVDGEAHTAVYAVDGIDGRAPSR